MWRPFAGSTSWRAVLVALPVSASCFLALGPSSPCGEPASDTAQFSSPRGICAVLGAIGEDRREQLIRSAGATEWTFFFQASNPEEIDTARRFAIDRGILGTRVFIEPAPLCSIHLANNLADLLFTSGDSPTPEAEILRVLRPGGVAHVGDRQVVKPMPEGTDAWSHPYHTPDNNTLSTDRLARAPYLTQFMAEPMFSPMPEVTVAAGGRVFKACGHIAHKKNQNQQLNTLLGINGYNGTILWTRPLAEGFMIHRNTMIATPEVLYLADDVSCKVIDAATGKTLDEIVVDLPQADGPVWKWMALVDGVLYAIVGGKEVAIHRQPSDTPGLGHWPWGMWEGHDYANPETNFGFGRTILAMDPKSKKVLWAHREELPLDSRGVCMADGKIYAYCPEEFLICISAETGKTLWKNDQADLLAAIGPNGKAQHYITGYATTTYIKCNDNRLFFAGPQRQKLVVASAADGRLLWTKDRGNVQIVLRDDGFYAAGAQDADASFKFSYEGDILARLPHRRACTRATGTIDSIFFRASGGTVRVDVATNVANHIAPMRPPCQDGVLVSDGHLYWGPWMCGCQLSAYGHIALGPAGDFNFRPGLGGERLTVESPAGGAIEALPPGDASWTSYQGDCARSMVSKVEIPARVSKAWEYALPNRAFPTAPIACGGRVFLADRNGLVRALDAKTGGLVWETFTAGPVYFPPEAWENRLYVGSADGRVYALEAATGKRLWTFQAAPANQRIPVYGKLISRWPVAGGVVVDRGTVYAAAGMAHYDGVHVYALDAASGRVKWYNDTSGKISDVTGAGVSLQGELAIRGGELRFLGGGAYEFARYDLADGKCLNEPRDEPSSLFHTAFYAYYPEYGKYVSLEYALPGGEELVYDASYEGSRHSELALLGPLPAGAPRTVKVASRWQSQRRGETVRKTIWKHEPGLRYNSFAIGQKNLLAAGHAGEDDQTGSSLAAIELATGKVLWKQDLSGAVVKAGTAVDREGRILVALRDGKVLCYAGK